MTDFSQQAATFLARLQAVDGLDAPGASRLLLPALLHNRSEAEAAKLLAELQPSFSGEAWTAVREAVAASKLLILLTKLFDTLRRQTERPSFRA